MSLAVGLLCRDQCLRWSFERLLNGLYLTDATDACDACVSQNLFGVGVVPSKPSPFALQLDSHNSVISCRLVPLRKQT